MTHDDAAALAARIRGLRDLAEIENRRSPWLGRGFSEEADRLEREAATTANHDEAQR